MKIYVSSSFLNKDGAKQMMKVIRACGHEITADWTVSPDGEKSISVLRKEAAVDFRGVMNAEALVIIPPGRLGTSTELGIALARGIPIFIIGMSKAIRKTNVFFNHKLVIHVPNKKVMLWHLDTLEHRK